MPPIISDPAEHLRDPAVLSDLGSQSEISSWLEKAINKGSIEPVLRPVVLDIGSAPRTRTCLSTSETMT